MLLVRVEVAQMQRDVRSARERRARRAEERTLDFGAAALGRVVQVRAAHVRVLVQRDRLRRQRL